MVMCVFYDLKSSSNQASRITTGISRCHTSYKSRMSIYIYTSHMMKKHREGSNEKSMRIDDRNPDSHRGTPGTIPPRKSIR